MRRHASGTGCGARGPCFRKAHLGTPRATVRRHYDRPPSVAGRCRISGRRKPPAVGLRKRHRPAVPCGPRAISRRSGALRGARVSPDARRRKTQDLRGSAPWRSAPSPLREQEGSPAFPAPPYPGSDAAHPKSARRSKQCISPFVPAQERGARLHSISGDPESRELDSRVRGNERSSATPQRGHFARLCNRVKRPI